MCSSRSSERSLTSDAYARTADGAQGGQLRAVRALAPEGVVDVLVDVGDRAGAAHRPKNPELLEAGDVRVAPHEGRDLRRDARRQTLVRDRREQLVGRRASALELATDFEACLHPRTVAEGPAVGKGPKG